MEIEISKELLSEVLGIKVILVDTKYTSSTNRVRYVTPDTNDYYIHCYDLEKKCLRWGCDKGYSFEIIPFCVSIVNLETDEQKSFRYIKEDIENKIPFLSQYVFKACQWILDNKK